MVTDNFEDYIRKAREELRLPLRKVAAYLDIDASTLSKIERGTRPCSSNYLQPLSEILKLDIKVVQAKFIADRINKDFAGMEYLNEGLKEAQENYKRTKR